MEAPDADEVSVFMSQLGLHEDVEILRKERITMDILKDMTKQELKSIGIPFGNSVKITRALAKNSSAAENKESSFEETKTEVESSSDVISDVDASPPSAKFKDNLKMFKELKHLPIKCGPIAGKEEDYADEFKELEDEVRIVLLGKTGSGKSATGNSILGIDSRFKSTSSASSITVKCMRGVATRFKKDIHVIDTPGLFDTGSSNSDVQKEIIRCISLTTPGPHVFILVLGSTRFTKEEYDAVTHFVDHFGEEIYNYFIILFTRKDDWSHDNKTLKEHLESIPPNLKEIVEKCGNRCIAFNNRARGIIQQKQVKSLLMMIKEIICTNGKKFYTNEMYEEATRLMKEREDEIKKELEKKRQEEIKKIRDELELTYQEKTKENQKKLDEMTEKYQSMEKVVTTKNTEFEDLKNSIVSLTEHLKTQKEDDEKSNKKLHDLIKEKTDELSSFKNDLKDLGAKLDNIEKEKKKKEVELEKITKEKKEKEEELTKYKVAEDNRIAKQKALQEKENEMFFVRRGWRNFRRWFGDIED